MEWAAVPVKGWMNALLACENGWLNSVPPLTPYPAFMVVGMDSIFQSCPPFITLKWIITILCMCPWCFISMSLFMFRLLEYSLASRQNLVWSLRYYRPSGPLGLEMFQDLFFARFMAPSFLCYIFLTFLISNYFGISVIPSYIVRKEAVLFWCPAFHGTLPCHNRETDNRQM